MQHLEVSCAVRRFFKSLGFKGLTNFISLHRVYVLIFMSRFLSICETETHNNQQDPKLNSSGDFQCRLPHQLPQLPLSNFADDGVADVQELSLGGG